MISCQYKCDETLKATEETALAINDISPQGQINMQQHVKKLVQDEVKNQLTPSKKRKNFQGGKNPQPSSPVKRKNGDTSTTRPKKKVSFKYPISDTEDSSIDEVKQPRKKQKLPHKTLIQSPKKNQKRNERGNQGGKKNGVRRGKKPNKSN
jgi:hypothetical protein